MHWDIGKTLALALGPIMFVVAAVHLVVRLRFRRTALPAPGVVIGVEGESSSDGSSYRLEVRYLLPDGREVTFKESGQGHHEVGAPVRVLYDPARPERAFVHYESWHIWAISIVFLAMGAFITYLFTFVWPAFS